MSQETVDFAPIADVVCRILGPAAMEHPDIRPRRDNVEVRVGNKDKSGRVLFRFMHTDRFLVEFEVDVALFLKDPQAYLGGIVRDVALAIENARRRRQAETVIFLPPSSAVH